MHLVIIYRMEHITKKLYIVTTLFIKVFCFAWLGTSPSVETLLPFDGR